MFEWLERDNVRPFVKLICRVLLTLLCLLVLSLIMPIFFSFFLPFVLAFVAASALNPLISLLQRKLKAPRSILAVLMVSVVLLSLAAAAAGLIYALIREIVALAQDIDGILEYFSQTVLAVSYHLYWILDYIPADAEEMLSNLMDGFMLWVQSQGTAFADAVISQTANVASRVGGGFVSVVIFVMAAYFMMADYPRLALKLRSIFSSKIYESYTTLKDVTLKALGSYLRAQLLMAFIAFIFSLAAFLIIRQEFALLLAFLIGVIDFVPLLGAAAVLVPWAIVSMIAGEIGKGIYLLAMSLVTFLLRRILEPKIVGIQMGLSPLTALLSIYIGMQLGGVLGLVLGPIVAMVLVSLYKAGIFDGWIKDTTAVLKLLKG